ncbi:MAG: hypothetical protein RL367_454 [Pseudomonadota bacterium]
MIVRQAIRQPWPVTGVARRTLDQRISGDLPGVAMLLPLTAMGYNGVLAFINGNIMSLGYPVVVITELMILMAGLAVVAARGLVRSDLPNLIMIYAVLILAIIVSMVNDVIFLDSIRNFCIVAIFGMIGWRANQDFVCRLFFFASLAVLFFLVIELASTPAYVGLFQPARYLENTRGLSQFELNDTGLFANALGYESRFSFGIFNTPRTSSLFVEQVSLANYSAVLSLFMVSMWQALRPGHRALHIILIALIVLSNNTRTSSALAMICVAGYFIYPRLPRFSNLGLVPLLLCVALGVFFGHGPQTGDDLVGRLSISMHDLVAMDIRTVFGGSVVNARHLFDSGYAYVIASTTLAGLAGFWLYVTLIVPQDSAPQKRCAWALNVYIFCWLLIGGTAIFSIKIAALLWLLVGHMRRHPPEIRADA